MDSGRVYISHHVTFDEHTFPYQHATSQQSKVQKPLPLPTILALVISQDLFWTSSSAAPPPTPDQSTSSLSTPTAAMPSDPTPLPDLSMSNSPHDDYATCPTSPSPHEPPTSMSSPPSVTPPTPTTSPPPHKFRSVQELQKLLHGPPPHPLP